MSRPIEMHIDSSALKNNFMVALRLAPHSHHFSVIKANAYGHGVLRIAKFLREAGTHGFALLNLEDAILLREHQFQQQILLLEGLFEYNEYFLALRKKINLVIHSAEQLALFLKFEQEFADHKELEKKSIKLFLKINSGMNRLGIMPNLVNEYVQKLKRLPHVEQIILMSHFATADESRGIDEQMQVISEINHNYLNLFNKMPKFSLANSAALIRHPQSHYDWVRPGIMLYGASPFDDVAATDLNLEPVMTLSSQLISIQELNQNDEVGYGANFKAPESMKIGIVACGYADGYPRHAPTGTPILVDGVLTQTLGRVSMDMLCVDLRPVPQAQVGSPVVLWGKGLPVESVAKSANTISYELLCGVTKRVKNMI